MDCPICRRPDQPATCATCVSKCLDSMHSHPSRIQYLESLRNRAAVLLANQSNPHSNHKHDDLQLDIASCSARVRALAVRKDEVQNRIAQRQHHLAARRKFLQHKRHALDVAVKRANAFKVRAQHAVNIELATRRANLQKAHESIMDAWKILVPELFQIFCVEQVMSAATGLSEVGTGARGTAARAATSASTNMEPAWTIVGLKVPLDMDIRGAPQDQLNAALGYTAHLTAILGMYLNIPLPFDLQLRMSATTADLHFRPDRDSLRPFAVPLCSTPTPPPSLSSSISRSFTSRHRSSKHAHSSASPAPSTSRRRQETPRIVPDNLLPIHVGHAEGAERTALGLAILTYQVVTLAAACGVKLPTRASKCKSKGKSSSTTTGARSKLAPIDLVGVLASVAEAVVASGGPLAPPRSSSPPLPGSQAPVMEASMVSAASTCAVGVRRVSFRTLLAQITRKIYRDESKSGFRIVRPVMEGVAKSGVPRRPSGTPAISDEAAAASVQLPMSETGVLVPRTPPVSAASAGGLDEEEEDEDADSDEDDEDDLSDDDDEDENGDNDESFDPDETISATHLDAARCGGGAASFVAIDPAASSVMAQSVGPDAASASRVLAMSNASVAAGTRAGKSSSGKSRRHGGAKSSAMARSIMVRSVLAAAEGPRPTQSRSMLMMRQSMMAPEALCTPSPSLVLPPQGHIRPPLPPSGSGQQHPSSSQEQMQPPPSASQVAEDDEWEELDKTITLQIPPHTVSNPDDLLNDHAPPMTASVALLASPRRAVSDSKLLQLSDRQDDDDDLELIEPPSSVPAISDESSDAFSSPSSSSASTSRVLLSSVWNIGRRALATSYHLAVTAATAGIVSGPTSATSAMADAGNSLIHHQPPSNPGTPIMRSPVHPADALRPRQHQHQQPTARTAAIPVSHQPSRQVFPATSSGLAIARPLVGRTHTPPGVSGSRGPSSVPSRVKKRSNGGSSALTRSAL
ncbi:UV radiation resistance protein and autophagy-related subunit 14-domain-containing protein [Catenaria anguillulae PL171]|uniref:Autophagy-related protein 14 n=1 Tax=Catenaria anguillulae PL171 TaxID=765915 RepID=A0A1Y2I5A7_9FUNG|nr:UV radiation resistance protein and autophagy-related subunit 14-domain-containing protein [Catenaria anguillulae PL171]